MSLDVRVVDTDRGRVEAAFVGTSGPTVLVLHGMPGSYRQALPLARDLAGTYRVILPSRPGYGRTPLACGRTPDEQADAYAALLAACGVETTAVIGISGGGASGAAFAANHPQRCWSLVLVCALAPHVMEVDPKLRAAIAVPFLWEAVGTISRRRERRKLATATPDTLAAELHKELTPTELASLAEDPLMAERVVEFARSHADAPAPWKGFRNDARNIFAAHRTGAADLASITAPTLVLDGDSDTVVPSPHADFWAAAVPNARRETVSGAGHAFLITRRLQTMPSLLRHLQDSSPHDGAVDLRS